MGDAIPTTSTANQDKLRTYLAGVDHDALANVVYDWQYVPPPLNQTSDYLKDSATDETTLGKLGRGLATTLATAFHGTAEHLKARTALITPAATHLGHVTSALRAAQDHLDTWNDKPLQAPGPKPNPNDPQYDTTNPDNLQADGSPKPEHDYNKADSAYQTASSNYASDNGQREKIAGDHIATIDAAMIAATTSMKAIHQDSTSSSPGGGGGGGPVSGPGAIPPMGTVPVGGPRGTTHQDPAGPTGAPGTDPGVPAPGGTIHHHPVGSTGPTSGSNPGQGPGHAAPVWGGPDDGSTWNGTDPSGGQASSAGFPGGIGLGAAVLGGGVVAGAGGLAGLRALSGASAEEGALGLSERGAGAPAVLGKGVNAVAPEGEGTAGGRFGGGGVGAGSRGGSAEEGAGQGAGRGAGRGGGAGAGGRGKGKKRPDGEHGDMWDDGEDWIDDEGVAPGVLD